MPVVVNMSKMRKALALAKSRAEAEANALKFGRSKPEKLAEQRQADRQLADLDGHLRERE